MTIPTIIIPDVGERRRSATVDRVEFLRRWHEDYAAGRETIPPPTNTRFTHDPHWRENWLSIQAAHDGEMLIWKATRGLVYCAMTFWTLSGLLIGSRINWHLHIPQPHSLQFEILMFGLMICCASAGFKLMHRRG